MSNNMIERVAKAIWQLYPENLFDTWEQEKPKFWYYDQAKIIIQSMREPTEEMIEAGECKFFDSNNLEVKSGYQAMIDAALKED